MLDKHSAHISKETQSYLEVTPLRFVLVFTPTHGSWLNLIENQFSKTTRTMLRGIRVAGKQELIDRIHQYFEDLNADPVVRERSRPRRAPGSGARSVGCEAWGVERRPGHGAVGGGVECGGVECGARSVGPRAPARGTERWAGRGVRGAKRGLRSVGRRA